MPLSFAVLCFCVEATWLFLFLQVLHTLWTILGSVWNKHVEHSMANIQTLILCKTNISISIFSSSPLKHALHARWTCGSTQKKHLHQKSMLNIMWHVRYGKSKNHKLVSREAHTSVTPWPMCSLLVCSGRHEGCHLDRRVPGTHHGGWNTGCRHSGFSSTIIPHILWFYYSLQTYGTLLALTKGNPVR